jgi:hypothetical protein
MYSVYGSFTHNFKVNRFNLGYGINESINSWNLRDTGGTTESITKTSSSLGITTSLYYQVGKHFFTGLIYRPSLLRLDPKFELKYEHLLSVDFGWKIKLK